MKRSASSSVLLLSFLLTWCSLISGSPIASVPSQPFDRSGLWKVRGGESAPSSSKLLQAEDTLRRYFDENSGEEKFYIQGWRWHTMSVLREARRLQRLAHRIADNEASSSAELSQLQKAADYVLGFNMKALHRVEAVFFPFIRKEMANSEESTPQVRGAFETVLDSLEKDRLRLQQMSDSIQSRCSKRSNTPTPEIAQMVAAQSGAIVDLTRSMLEREVSLVIPTVGRFIPEKEQKKFNNLVINKCLGILESRCHLVHMHEVVTEANCPKEQQLWKESIPKIPRSMVPRWKRTLYEPRSSALENL